MIMLVKRKNKMKSDCFGINIKEYCKVHELVVKADIDEGRVTEDLIANHLEMLRRIQHERLVHLIVTAMCVVCELFVVDLVLLHPELGVIPAIIMLVLAVLLGFYFYHYFFLENTVQSWYKLADKINACMKYDTDNSVYKIKSERRKK